MRWKNLAKMWILSFILFTMIIHIIRADVGDNCEPNGPISEGVCTLKTYYEVALRCFMNKEYDKLERCGFLGDEIDCCPRITNKFGRAYWDKTHASSLSSLKKADRGRANWDWVEKVKNWVYPKSSPSSSLRKADRGSANWDTPKSSSPSSLRKADRECEKIIKSIITPLDVHILGGEIATPGEFPHMVALGFDRGKGYIFDCGGALVSTSFVITAAHCIDTRDKIKPSIVRVGVVEIGSSEWNDKSDIRIDEIILHPDYKRRAKYHDLALLRLEQPVTISSDVNAVCLYTGSQDPTASLTITGWGTTSTSKNVRSTVLLKTNVSVVSRETCGESYTQWLKLPTGIGPGQLCAGDPSGQHDSCQGDSGGPLQLVSPQTRLVGVTSFGRGCGSTFPGVYTSLRYYLDWIEQVVWPN